MRVFLSLFFFFFCLSICSYRKRNESKRKEGNQGEKMGDQLQVVRNAFPVFSAIGFLRESKELHPWMAQVLHMVVGSID